MSTAFVQPDIEESRPLQDAASSGSGGPSGSMQTQNAGTNSSAGVGSFVTDTFRQSAHPVALLFLFLFRSMAIATYLLCGFFTSGYVFSVRIFLLLIVVFCDCVCRMQDFPENIRNIAYRPSWSSYYSQPTFGRYAMFQVESLSVCVSGTRWTIAGPVFGSLRAEIRLCR